VYAFIYQSINLVLSKIDHFQLHTSTPNPTNLIFDGMSRIKGFTARQAFGLSSFILGFFVQGRQRHNLLITNSTKTLQLSDELVVLIYGCGGTNVISKASSIVIVVIHDGLVIIGYTTHYRDTGLFLITLP